MEQEKNNKGVIALLVVIIVILLALVVLLATGTISFKHGEANTNENNNQQTNESNDAQTNTNENNNQQNNEVIDRDTNADTSGIQTKLVDNISCQNSNTTFNNITVNIEAKNNDGICSSKILVNGIDISSKIKSSMTIISYEFFDNNVIVFSSDTSLPGLTIYNVDKQETMVNLVSFDTRYYVQSYETENNKILVNGKSCAGQCSNDPVDAVYPDQKYEIDYLGNGTFSEIRKIN